MYWTLELASKLEDAPWPATKDELIDYAIRSGAPLEVIENLQEMEDEGEAYDSIEDIWPDYPSKDDFFFNEEEYQNKALLLKIVGGLAQLARAFDWQSKGQRFDSAILHRISTTYKGFCKWFFVCPTIYPFTEQ